MRRRKEKRKKEKKPVRMVVGEKVFNDLKSFCVGFSKSLKSLFHSSHRGTIKKKRKKKKKVRMRNDEDAQKTAARELRSKIRKRRKYLLIPERISIIPFKLFNFNNSSINRMNLKRN